MGKTERVKGARSVGRFTGRGCNGVIDVGFMLRPGCGAVLDSKCTIRSVVGGVSVVSASGGFVRKSALVVFSRLRRFPSVTATLGSFGVSKEFSIVYDNSLLKVGCEGVRDGDIKCGASCRVFSVSFRRFL